ncbi:hypothetical protein ACYSNR_15640 [Enterococcus sp. LJL128]
MGNEKSRQLSNQLQEVEEERELMQKKKNFWEEAKEHWRYLQREEQAVLEEIAYLSQGTVSANHAQEQLDVFEAESFDIQRQFAEIDERFESKGKALYTREDELTNDYYEAKQQEAEDDEI